MAASHVKHRCLPGGRALTRLFAAACAAGTASMLLTSGAHAQRLPPADCLQPGEPLYRIPVLGATPAPGSPNGKLNGVFVLTDELRRLGSSTDCALQYLRHFVSKDAAPQPILPGSENPPPSPVGAKYPDGFPGPTLRARVGDIVQLTFLNQVNPLNYPNTLDRGDNANACDQFSAGYPASVSDTFPNCFHGSSTANIHFHGTHVNPTSTGDNVFLQIRPSPRADNKPIVTAESVAASFNKFFTDCEAQLKPNVLSEWPYTWKDLPQPWTQEQEKLLKAYDNGTTPYFPPAKPVDEQVWPSNQQQLAGNLWPQYYVGAFPYCFQIPEYKAPNWPPTSGLKMGQAPGTHWYHAHKHGSTALNVANGMTGAFIIEGKYDDELNAFYGDEQTPLWTRTQPVLVINSLGVTPNLARGVALGAFPFSVNGRSQPKLTMRPGEVQLWRIVNTSGQRAAFFVGPPKLDPTKKGYDPKTDFEWRQLAQDGVQLFETNYQKSQNITLQVASGNRVDLLVKAPTNPGAAPYNFIVRSNHSSSDLKPPVTLLSVAVSGTAPENVKRTQFIPHAPTFPRFLADITDDEVRYTPKRTFVFDSKAQAVAHQHTLNGEQFSETGIGITTFLSSVEEWKVVNTTSSTTGPGPIDHPFHIHINPFQVVEVFDPNEQITDPGDPTKQLPKYVSNAPTYPTLQCQLNLSDPDTWKDCHNVKRRWEIWWDVFPIPTARSMTPTGGTTAVTVPGFFRMRSRFVDYPGLWVIHCHILAHEDRGMMTIVQVLPQPTLQMKHH
jgi:FtsP/CotA-like multicopper oxidase with cupredoxin domain